MGRGRIRKAAYLVQLFRIASEPHQIQVVSRQRLSLLAFLSHTFSRSRRATLVHLVQHLSPLNPSAESRVRKHLSSHLVSLLYRLPGVEYIAVSHWLAAQVGPHCRVIANGVREAFFEEDTLRSLLGPPATPRVGIIGRPGPAKGYDVFIGALHELERDWADRVEVRLVDHDRQLPLPEGFRCRVVLPVDDDGLREFYSSLTVFVSSSRQEGFGIAPLEAMACGTPVVLSSCGGHLEYGSPDNCLLVTPGKSEELARAVAQVLADEALRDRLRRSGLETAERFRESLSLDRHLEFYESILLRRTPPSNSFPSR
jgi:glycosyltransferase involved in cell wall biosynthesis